MSDLLLREPGAIRIGPFGSALKKDEYSESGIRVLGIDDVLTRGSPRKPKFIPEAKYRELTQYRVRAGDILVTNMGTVGRAFLLPPGFETAIISSHLIKVTPDLASVDAHYLEWALNAAPAVVAQIVRDSRGAIMAGFNTSRLKALAIPLPPLAEQRRIAGILDKADSLRAMRRDAMSRLQALDRSIFLQTFGDPLTNPKGWPQRTIREIGTVITGNTPPRAQSELYGGPTEWIKSDNLNTPEYFLTTAAETLSILGTRVARLAPPNAVLVTCIAGSPECIGNAAMADREVAFNQQINAFIPSEGNPHFLYSQLRFGKRLVQQAATKAMKGMISKTRFEAIKLMCPPRTDQDAYADRTTMINAAARRATASLTQLDALFASLQDRAFRGDL